MRSLFNIAFVLLITPLSALALPGAEVIPEVAGGVSSRPYDNAPFLRERRGLRVIWNLRCYGANLRASYSTIGPDSLITLRFKLKDNDPVEMQVKVREAFEGQRLGTLRYTASDGSANRWVGTGGAGGRNPLVLEASQGRSSQVVAQLNEVAMSRVDVDSDGNFVARDNPLQFDEPPHFTQSGTAISGPLKNYNGFPQYQITDPRGGELVVNAMFVGQRGYCGSYVSPLMLFFDGDRPHFSGESEFPLDPHGRRIYWVEKNAPGYFLALDRDNDGKITAATELFGNANTKNGFEVLKKLDSNGDGHIDNKDRAFKSLLLWKDANADGVSQKSELVSIGSKGVTSLALKYRDNQVLEWSNRASARQFAEFSFRDKKGVEKKGALIDIWFQPAARKLAKHP